MQATVKVTGNNTIQTLILSIGSIFVIGLSIAMGAVLSRLLSKEDYGTFRQILYVYTTIAFLFEVGMPKASAYFLPKLPLEQGKTILKQIVWILFASGLSFALFLYFGAEAIAALLRNPGLVAPLKAYAPIPAFLLPALALQGVCMTFSRAREYTVYQVFTKALALAAVCVPIYLGYSMTQAIHLWSFVSFSSLCLALVMMFWPYFKVISSTARFNLKDLLKFCSPLLLVSGLSTILFSTDKFLVSRYLGPEVFAVYINGAFEFPLISIITSSTAAVLLPVFSRLHEEKEGSGQILEVWNRALSKTTMILYPLIMLCFVFAEEIISIIYSASYSHSAVYFRLYLLIGLVRVVSFMPLMIGIGALRSYVYGHIIACLCMLGFGWLSYHFALNPINIAICYVSSTFIMVGVFFAGISRKLNVSVRALVPFKLLLIYLCLSFVSGLAAWLLTTPIAYDMYLARLIAGTIAFVSVYLIISRIAGINSLEFLLPILVRCGFSRK